MNLWKSRIDEIITHCIFKMKISNAFLLCPTHNPKDSASHFMPAFQPKNNGRDRLSNPKSLNFSDLFRTKIGRPLRYIKTKGGAAACWPVPDWTVFVTMQ